MRVTTVDPVVVMHPITEQPVALKRGDEVTDKAIIENFAWAFEQPVEAASATPGEKRQTVKQ